MYEQRKMYYSWKFILLKMHLIQKPQLWYHICTHNFRLVSSLLVSIWQSKSHHPQEGVFPILICIVNISSNEIHFSPFYLYLTLLTGSSFSSQYHISLVLPQSMDQQLYASQQLCSTISLPAKPVAMQMCESSHFNTVSRIKQI